ncbi:MAG: hypothetical protein GAS50_11745 [Desulfobacterales bacterium]|nr:hypothetical protein [Desulfobacterales bacterium]
MKNSRIRYHKERIGHNYKEIMIIEQTAGQKTACYTGFFLNDILCVQTVSCFECITPEAHA